MFLIKLVYLFIETAQRSESVGKADSHGDATLNHSVIVGIVNAVYINFYYVVTLKNIGTMKSILVELLFPPEDGAVNGNAALKSGEDHGHSGLLQWSRSSLKINFNSDFISRLLKNANACESSFEVVSISEPIVHESKSYCSLA